MYNFLAKRFLNAILVMFGVVSLVFVLFNVLPADPARMVLGQRSDEASLQAVRKDMGLDRTAWVRYLKYLNDLSPLSYHKSSPESFFYYNPEILIHSKKILKVGNKIVVVKAPYLRRSYQSKKSVTGLISGAILNTFVLAITSILLASLFGILLGIVAAIKKDSFIDKAFLFISALGMSVPSFFAAILIGWFFAFVLGNYTGLNLTGNLYEIDDFGEGEYIALKNLILPALTLSVRPLSVFLQLTRNSVLDVKSHEYIRTAYAKGLSDTQVMRRHVLKNALNPVVTSISGWFASLMAGVVFVEYIFGWKGLGYLVVDALNNFDVPLIMGCILTTAIIFVLINIMVDIVYNWLDPRVRLG